MTPYRNKDNTMRLSPRLAAALAATLLLFSQAVAAAPLQALLLTSPGVRPFVRSIIERFRPSTVVLSQNEIHPKAKIKTLGQV